MGNKKFISYIAIPISGIVLVVVFLIFAVWLQNKSKEERAVKIDQFMTYKNCMNARDSIFKVYFPEGFWIKEQVHSFKKDVNPDFPKFFDDSSITVTIKGKKYYCSYSMEVLSNFNSKSWDLWELKVWDRGTLNDILIVKYGEKQDLSDESSSTTINDRQLYVNDDDIYNIEDALQREWDASNAAHSSGAESCNVFKVKIKGTDGDEVKVHYSLRSTFNGEKKFVELDGVLKKLSDGSWEVINLGY